MTIQITKARLPHNESCPCWFADVNQIPYRSTCDSAVSMEVSVRLEYEVPQLFHNSMYYEYRNISVISKSLPLSPIMNFFWGRGNVDKTSLRLKRFRIQRILHVLYARPSVRSSSEARFHHADRCAIFVGPTYGGVANRRPRLTSLLRGYHL
jgi:hypothetical protein